MQIRVFTLFATACVFFIWILLIPSLVMSAVAVSKLPSPSPSPSALSMYGTNFGGWLVLEDWFYSANSGKYVSTPTGLSDVAVCFPPMFKNLSWSSEKDLVKKIEDYDPQSPGERGGQQAVFDAFNLHRSTFITKSDVVALAQRGVKHIRIPVSWTMWTYDICRYLPDLRHNSTSNVSYCQQHDKNDDFTVYDPYYYPVWTTNTKTMYLEHIIAAAVENDVKLELELHTMPGGSSFGTYNALWPLTPVFWTEKDIFNLYNMSDYGVAAFQVMLDFIESLSESEKATIEGVSSINEPGHLIYLSKEVTTYNFGLVLDFLTKTTNEWKTRYAKHKVYPKLFVQIVHTAFTPSSKVGIDNLRGLYIGSDLFDDAFNNGYASFIAWLDENLPIKEFVDSTVVDLHYYDAWGETAGWQELIPNCMAITNKQDCLDRPGCNPTLSTSGFMIMCQSTKPTHNCSLSNKYQGGAENAAKAFRRDFPKREIAITEWSAATFDQAPISCRNRQYIEKNVRSQISLFEEHDIHKLYFWSYKFTYGQQFQNAWASQNILGIQEQSKIFECGSPTNGINSN